MSSQLESEASLDGDVLESIFSYVPLIDLVPASHVSKSWKSSVSSSLRNVNPAKPWLIIHTQNTRLLSSSITSRAYDPRSHTWLEIKRSPVQHLSAVRSSHPNLLYKITPSKFSFSCDPLNLTWHDAPSPRVWRVDPLISLVSSHIVVLGGVCDFEDDPLSVETYNLKTHTWETCPSMPSIFKSSSSATWLAVTTNRINEIFLTEKCSGNTCAYNTVTKVWRGPKNWHPDPRIYFSVNGFFNGRLILIGLTKYEENVKIKLYEVDEDLVECKEIGDVPEEFVKKLENEDCEIPSISVSFDGNFVYMCNNCLETEEVIFGEFFGGEFKWGSVQNIVVDERDRVGGKVMMCCRSVEIRDLQEGLKSNNCEFTVIA